MLSLKYNKQKLLYKDYLFFPNRRTRRDLRVESPLISSIWLSYKSKNISLCRLEIFWIRVIKLCWKFNKRRCSSPSMIGHTVSFCLKKHFKKLISFWFGSLPPLTNISSIFGLPCCKEKKINRITSCLHELSILYLIANHLHKTPYTLTRVSIKIKSKLLLY